MADVLNKKQRSYCMSQVKSKSTRIEVHLRKMVWEAGFRGYRLNFKIFGKPDIYFPKKKIAIFIDGCFWHKCGECYIRPKTNKKFWDEKIESNVARDKVVSIKLRNEGVEVIRIWEHEIEKPSGNEYLNLIRRAYEREIS